jgi:hypothetical protein
MLVLDSSKTMVFGVKSAGKTSKAAIIGGYPISRQTHSGKPGSHFFGEIIPNHSSH